MRSAAPPPTAAWLAGVRPFGRLPQADRARLAAVERTLSRAARAGAGTLRRPSDAMKIETAATLFRFFEQDHRELDEL